ncbi:MAG TPA: hypothetical protein VF578_13155 [Methylomirabilota bacterium]
MISLAEDVRDIAGWPAIEWGMNEEQVREALTGRVSPITPIAKFANAYAPIKGSVTIEEYPFEMFPQFSHATGELCQVLFRAADAEADRLERMSEILTACYGSPVERGTKRTWRGPTAVVELDTVKLSANDEQLWVRWYPAEEMEGA